MRGPQATIPVRDRAFGVKEAPITEERAMYSAVVVAPRSPGAAVGARVDSCRPATKSVRHGR
jgi:hypothetical protein